MRLNGERNAVFCQIRYRWFQGRWDVSQSAMRKSILLIIVALFFSLLLAYAVSYSIRLRNQSKYDKTVLVLTEWADRYKHEHTLQVPPTDAWGRCLTVTTNNEQIVMVSKGVDVESKLDDITLTINKEHGSYSIFYSYASKHYNSGVYY